MHCTAYQAGACVAGRPCAQSVNYEVSVADGVSSCVRALFGTGTFRSILNSGLGETTNETHWGGGCSVLLHFSMDPCRKAAYFTCCPPVACCCCVLGSQRLAGWLDWQPYDSGILLDLFYMENYVSYFSCFGMDKQFACFAKRCYSWITTSRSLEGCNTLFFPTTFQILGLGQQLQTMSN